MWGERDNHYTTETHIWSLKKKLKIYNEKKKVSSTYVSYADAGM